MLYAQPESIPFIPILIKYLTYTKQYLLHKHNTAAQFLDYLYQQLHVDNNTIWVQWKYGLLTSSSDITLIEKHSTVYIHLKVLGGSGTNILITPVAKPTLTIQQKFTFEASLFASMFEHFRQPTEISPNFFIERGYKKNSNFGYLEYSKDPMQKKICQNIISIIDDTLLDPRSILSNMQIQINSFDLSDTHTERRKKGAELKHMFIGKEGTILVYDCLVDAVEDEYIEEITSPSLTISSNVNKEHNLALSIDTNVQEFHSILISGIYKGYNKIQVKELVEKLMEDYGGYDEVSLNQLLALDAWQLLANGEKSKSFSIIVRFTNPHQ